MSLDKISTRYIQLSRGSPNMILQVVILEIPVNFSIWCAKNYWKKWIWSSFISNIEKPLIEMHHWKHGFQTQSIQWIVKGRCSRFLRLDQGQTVMTL